MATLFSEITVVVAMVAEAYVAMVFANAFSLLATLVLIIAN